VRSKKSVQEARDVAFSQLRDDLTEQIDNAVKELKTLRVKIELKLTGAQARQDTDETNKLSKKIEELRKQIQSLQAKRGELERKGTEGKSNEEFLRFRRLHVGDVRRLTQMETQTVMTEAMLLEIENRGYDIYGDRIHARNRLS
jgi:polyhydroxyalkanoate synthesis regulator phasin